jgi:glucose/arabinose dehydrogenase
MLPPRMITSRWIAALSLLAWPLVQAQAQSQEERERAIVHRHALEQADAAAVQATDEAAERTALRLRVPPGFRVNVFASGLKHPRMMDVGEDGTLYVTRRDEGDVLALRDDDGDGHVDSKRVFVSRLPGVHGIARRGGWLYLAASTTVWRTPLDQAAPQTLITGLPDGGQHANRMLRFGPDGMIYISVGSSCNDCAEDNQLERGTLIRYTPDGRRRDVLAKGLRNTIGYDWHPDTGALWGMDNGTDFRGDKRPEEELNRIEAGRNYGWPICDPAGRVDEMTNAPPERMALEPGQRHPIGWPMAREDYCRRTTPAVLTTTPHAAPLALRFYTGRQFPPAYRGDAFVALHGSWNRKDPVGYKVSRIRFSPRGEPMGFEPFLDGFIDAGAGVVYGRPAGLAIAADGALLVSDDLNGVIYRVAYAGR